MTLVLARELRGRDIAFVQRTQLGTPASSYSDVFLVTALVTLLAIPLRARQRTDRQGPPPEL